MKTLKLSSIFFVIAVLVAGLVGSTRAQEKTEGTRPSFESGPYIFNLGLEAGYRNTDVTTFDGDKNTWAENRFYEAYNLRSGLNLNSFNLFGERKGEQGFFDEMYVNASGLNDPFTTGSLRLRQFNSYDLKVDFRQAKYFLNRNDSIFTGLHKYDMTRDFLNASLDINAAENFKVNLKFNSISRSGSMNTTMSPFLENGEELIGSYVGGIYRGDFYWINVPKNDKTTEFSAGLTYALPKASSISLGGGLRSFSQEFSPTLISDTSLTYTNFAGPSYFSQINGYWAPASKTNPKGATPFESLNIGSYTDHRESSGPFAYLQGVAKPMDELTITADVRYESSASKPWVKYDLSGVARTAIGPKYDTAKSSPTYGQVSNYGTKAFDSYEGIFDANADKMDWNSLVGNVVISGKLMEDLSINANLGMSQLNEQTEASHTITITQDTGSKALKATKNTTESFKNDYKIPQQSVDAFLSFNPALGASSLGVRAGVKYSNRKPDITAEDEYDSTLSRQITAVTPYLSLNVYPVRGLRLDARVSQTTRSIKNPDGTASDMPIRTAPEKILNLSGGISLQPIDRMNFGVRYNAVNGTSTFSAVTLPWTSQGGQSIHAMNLPELDYTNDMSSITATLGYFVKDLKLGFNVSGQYKTNKYSIPSTWTRGNAVPTNYPGYIDSFTVMIGQNTIDRFLDFSLNWEPVTALHLDGGFSITRSTGDPTTFVGTATGIIGDTTHFGGPFSMQNYHIAAAYDVTPNIGINAEYQHVAYKEDKEGAFWALNNFAGNLIRGGFALKF